MKHRWLLIPMLILITLSLVAAEKFDQTTSIVYWVLCFVGILCAMGIVAFLYYEWVYKAGKAEKQQLARAVKQYKITALSDVSPIKAICGDIFPVTSRDDFAGGNVVFLEATQPAKPHYHRETTEFYIVVDGHGILWLNGKVTPIRPGMVAIIRPGTIHSVAPVPGETLQVWVVAVPAWRAEDEIEV